MLELLHEGAVGLLRGGEVAGLQGGAKLVKELADLTRSAAAVMMMVMTLGGTGLALRGLILKILLDGGEVLLGGGKIAGLEIFRELAESLGDGTVSLRGRGGVLCAEILQGSEIGLRRGEIAGLQVLAELLEFLAKLLRVVLNILRVIETAAGNA